MVSKKATITPIH